MVIRRRANMHPRVKIIGIQTERSLSSLSAWSLP